MTSEEQKARARDFMRALDTGDEQAMADLLGIPIDEVTQVGLFPVAYTVGTEFKPGAREASADTIRWNRW